MLQRILQAAVWRLAGAERGQESKLRYQLGGYRSIQGKRWDERWWRCCEVVRPGRSVKVVLTALADGLHVKYQRKKRIKDDSEAITKMQLPLTKLQKKTVGREASPQEEESSVFNVLSLR